MLPALASTSDLSARLPAGLSTDALARAQAALDDASAMIRAEVGQDWVDDEGALDGVPDVAVTICLACAKRVIDNPDGATSRTIDGYAEAFANASSDVYLTASERRMLQRLRPASGVWTLATTRSDLETDTIYADVIGTTEKMPITDGPGW